MIRFLLIALLGLAPLAAAAECIGRDIRPSLSATQKAALQRAEATMPFSYGNHWVARKGGRSIHVIGTMHVNDPRLPAIMRRLQPVIERADAVLFEVTQRDFDRFWNKLAPNSPFFFIQTGPTLPDVMSARDWADLGTAARAVGLAPEIAARLRPWVLSLMLSQSSCGPRGPFADNGLDMRIEKLARRKRVPTGSLENPDYHANLEAQRPLKDRARILMFELRTQQSAEYSFFTMREAYFEQRVAQGMIIEEWRFMAEMPGTRADRARLWRHYESNMLIRRNKYWVPRMMSVKGDTIVVAVGAAHLPGRDGILNLLKKAGYRLERAPF
ncbi:TraB/GumN family protein [Arenibacterium sp. CAU 1754]